MAVETFHRFPELVPELRVQIWHHAYHTEGPRIVEIRRCNIDHSLGRCYRDLCACKNPGSLTVCCYHVHKGDQEFCTCLNPRLTSTAARISDGHAHPAKGPWHVHRVQSSPSSAFFSTNREARHEALSFCSKLTFSSGRPLFFDFADKLAVDVNVLLKNPCLLGAEDVTSLILLHDKNPTAVCELVKGLEPFSGLQELQIVQNRSWGSGELLLYRHCTEGHSGHTFRNARDQFSWLRQKLGQHAVSNIQSVCAERTSHARERWGEYEKLVEAPSILRKDLEGRRLKASRTGLVKEMLRHVAGAREDLAALYTLWTAEMHFLEYRHRHSYTNALRMPRF